MNRVLFDLIPIFFLLGLGAVLGRVGFFSVDMIHGLKKVIASIALPALLFVAFSRIHINLELGLLALSIYVACGLMGSLGTKIARVAGLPLPSSTFMFQGFEAGMLGYALFAALFGKEQLRYFASADLGQVVFVFTALMTQLRRSESGERSHPWEIAKAMVVSPVILSIVIGLLASLVYPDAVGSPWDQQGALMPLLTGLGALTTPLVCLVVGFSLKDFRIGGMRQPLLFVVLRLLLATVVGGAISYVLQVHYGAHPLQAMAVLFLFLLPPPFVIPVFRSTSRDSAYIGSVLSLHTVLSIGAVVVLAVGCPYAPVA